MGRFTDEFTRMGNDVAQARRARSRAVRDVVKDAQETVAKCQRAREQMAQDQGRELAANHNLRSQAVQATLKEARTDMTRKSQERREQGRQTQMARQREVSRIREEAQAFTANTRRRLSKESDAQKHGLVGFVQSLKANVDHAVTEFRRTRKEFGDDYREGARAMRRTMSQQGEGQRRTGSSRKS